MEKTLPVAARNMSTHWQLPRWYHAVTLTERIAARGTSNGKRSDANADEFTRAERKVQRWKEQVPFDTGSFFADRLTMDGITESDLLELLAEPIEAVQARTAPDPSAPPYWLAELIEAFTTHSSASEAFPSLPVETDHSFACLQPILPLLTRGVNRLREGINDLTHQYYFLPFDPQAIVPVLFANLAHQVLPQFNKTFVLELNIARLRRRLQGETSEERFQSYLELLNQEHEIAALLSEYCVLARQLVVTTDLWAGFSLEFLQHLCTDWEQICALFTSESDPGALVKVMGGAGDTHREGRSVMVLEFTSGFRLVYKPKSLAIDVHFQELLTWLNEHGARPEFRITKLLDRGRYGWTEFIQAPECSSEEEVGRFYERQGGYLALLYALEATDFHAENVIASGEHPMLIDLEALFHPRPTKNDLTSFKHPGEELWQSVLRIGLLPQRMWSNKDAAGIDISGLGAPEGQLIPSPISTWEGSGTDEMRLVRKQVKTQAKKNRPRLKGSDVETVDYCDRIIVGFTAIYYLLIEHRREFVSEYLPRFADDEIRFVARATRAYGTLLNESFHPNKLRDALKRDRFFDRLWLAVEYQPHLSRLIPAGARSSPTISMKAAWTSSESVSSN